MDCIHTQPNCDGIVDRWLHSVVMCVSFGKVHKLTVCCIQNIEVNAVGVLPQHCVVLNTLEGGEGGESGDAPSAPNKRLVVVLRPGRHATVAVNGVRATDDTKLMHGDWYVCSRFRHANDYLDEVYPLCLLSTACPLGLRCCGCSKTLETPPQAHQPCHCRVRPVACCCHERLPARLSPCSPISAL